jgi:hypothetical protein
VTATRQDARALVMTALVMTGCVSHYQPPTAQDPHAVLKFRRVYHVHPGARLSEQAHVEENLAFDTTAPSALAEAPRIDATLLHPKPSVLHFDVGFAHDEMRNVQESYQLQTPYTNMESYSCGSYKSYQTCTRSVTQYRSETRYRMVYKPVEISDGRCAAALNLVVLPGRTYLAELTYSGPQACTLACYEQTADGKGGFINRPCTQFHIEE